MKDQLNSEQYNKLCEYGIDKYTLYGLISILPKKVTDRSKIYELKIWVDHYSEAWCVMYDCTFDCSDELDSFQSGEELIDALYNMLVWLKEDYNKNLVWL